MVDVGAKDATHRVARAQGTIRMKPETFAMISQGTAKKGDVIGIARVAAIMASKKTAELIPLCHPIALTRVAVDFELNEPESAVRCIATCETHGQTGVEMEALTGASIALLTIYDMCKAMEEWYEDAVAKGLEAGRKAGLEAGMEDGMEAGRKAGRTEGRIAIIIRMLSKGLDEEMIKSYTDGTDEEIGKAKMEMKIMK